MFQKVMLFTLALVLAFGLAMPVLAQDDAQDTSQEAEVTAEDLDVSSTSWLSRLWRDVKIVFTVDPVKKAELELEKANVKLWLAKGYAEENYDSEELQEKLDEKMVDFQEILDKVAARVEDYIADNPDSEKAQVFLDKLTQHELTQQEVLARIAEQVPEAVAQKIQERRQIHLDQFAEVMTKLQNSEQLRSRLHKLIGDGEEVIDRQMNRVQILERLQEAYPELEDELEEFMEENSNLINRIRVNYEDVIENRAEIQATIRNQAQTSNPENGQMMRKEERQTLKAQVTE